MNSLRSYLFILDIQNRKRFLCFHRVMVTRVKFWRMRNVEFSQTSTSITITQVNGFEPIRVRVVSCLFNKFVIIIFRLRH